MAVVELRGQAWPARTREAEQQQQTERDTVLGPVSCGFGAGNFNGFVIISVNFVAGAGEGAWPLAAGSDGSGTSLWAAVLLLSARVCVCMLCTSM